MIVVILLYSCKVIADKLCRARLIRVGCIVTCSWLVAVPLRATGLWLVKGPFERGD